MLRRNRNRDQSVERPEGCSAAGEADSVSNLPASQSSLRQGTAREPASHNESGSTPPFTPMQSYQDSSVQDFSQTQDMSAMSGEPASGVSLERAGASSESLGPTSVAVSPQPLLMQPAIMQPSMTQLELANTGETRVAFKVMTNHPDRFFVRPSSGFLKPQAKCAVQVMLQPKEDESATPVPINKPRLRVAYVPVNKTSFGRDPKINKELLSPATPGFGEVKMVVLSPHESTGGSSWSTDQQQGGKWRSSGSVGSGKGDGRSRDARQALGHRSCGALKIHPPDLEFELTNPPTFTAYCTLTNTGSKPVAYKITPPCPRSFQVKPNPAVIQPAGRQAIVLQMRQRSKGPQLSELQTQRVTILCVELPSGVGKHLSVDPSLFDQPVSNFGHARMKILPLPVGAGPGPVDDSAHEMAGTSAAKEASKLHIHLKNLQLAGGTAAQDGNDDD